MYQVMAHHTNWEEEVRMYAMPYGDRRHRPYAITFKKLVSYKESNATDGTSLRPLQPTM
jgi:hypothetical protein